MAKIAEGFGRRADKDFANFLNLAHGSAYEVQSHLYLAMGLNYMDEVRIDEIYAQLDEVCRMIYALGSKLRA